VGHITISWVVRKSYGDLQSCRDTESQAYRTRKSKNDSIVALQLIWSESLYSFKFEKFSKQIIDCKCVVQIWLCEGLLHHNKFYKQECRGFQSDSTIPPFETSELPSCFYWFGFLVLFLSASAVQKSVFAGACNHRPSIWESHCCEDGLSAVNTELNILGVELGSTNRNVP